MTDFNGVASDSVERALPMDQIFTPVQLQHVREVVAGHSRDASDCALLLSMIGTDHAVVPEK